MKIDENRQEYQRNLSVAQHLIGIKETEQRKWRGGNKNKYLWKLLRTEINSRLEKTTLNPAAMAKNRPIPRHIIQEFQNSIETKILQASREKKNVSKQW